MEVCVMTFTVWRKVININISKNGVYRFWPLSATGKSYLGYLLSVVALSNNSVCVIGRDITVSEISEEYLFNIQSHEPKLVLIDRYDFYKSESLVDFVKSMKDKAIIMIDVKNIKGARITFDDIIDIELKENGIEVC